VITKPATEMVNEATVAASVTTAAADSETLTATKGTQLAVEGIATFHGSATGDVRVHVRCSSTDSDVAFGQAVDLGASQDGYFDIPCSAGNTVRATAPFSPDGLYYRCFAQNLDGSYAATNVIINAILQEIEPT